MRIVVTGSSGQFGRMLVRSLRSSGHSVNGVDLVPSDTTTNVGPVDDRELLCEALRFDSGQAVTGAAAIVHVASLHAPHVATRSREDFIRTNVIGTENVIAAAAKYGIRRMVYTSTTSIYGHALEDESQAVWVTEDLAPRPRDIYDETKLAAEELCRDAARRLGIDCISLRVGRFFHEPARLMAIYRLYRGVDVRDVVMAHELAIVSKLPGFEVFNIAAQSPFQEDDLIELRRDAAAVLTRKYLRIAASLVARGWKLPTSIDRVYVIDRAKSLLGYRPRFNFGD